VVDLSLRVRHVEIVSGVPVEKRSLQIVRVLAARPHGGVESRPRAGGPVTRTTRATRRMVVSDDAFRPSDLFRFSLDARDVAAVAAGRIPPRIHRVCRAYVPLILDGDHTETDRRLAAIPDYRRLWRLVFAMRDALYADGLLSADEYQTLVEDGDE
jgi:hypothetical protein